MFKSNSELKTACVTIAVLMALVVLFVASPIATVPAGSVRVVTRWGRVTGRVLDPGMHLIVPLAESTTKLQTRKVIYETTTEENQKGSDADYKDYPVDTNTNDGQQVDIFYTVRFSIDPTKAAWVVQNIGDENALVEKIVKTESRIWARIIPREFAADYLYTGNVVEVQNKIFNSLEPVFSSNGLILDSVGIREIRFTDDYMNEIEAKQLEAVKVETEKNRAEQAKYVKEARITEAEGKAREQELQMATISPELLEMKKIDAQLRWIEAWQAGGSQVPNMMCGDSGVLFNMPTQ